MPTHNEMLASLYGMLNTTPYFEHAEITSTAAPSKTKLDELEARCAPTKRETPKKPRPITDHDVLALLKEQKRLIDRQDVAIQSLRARIEKLEARCPRFGWARG